MRIVEFEEPQEFQYHAVPAINCVYTSSTANCPWISDSPSLSLHGTSSFIEIHYYLIMEITCKFQ